MSAEWRGHANGSNRVSNGVWRHRHAWRSMKHSSVRRQQMLSKPAGGGARNGVVSAA